MKKKILFTVMIITMFSILTTSSIFAGTTYLWKHSADTYVSSYHPDNFLADTYKGVASVKGTDRTLNSDSRNAYFKWVKISYDVQGTIYEKIAYSQGKNSSKVVKETITVKDKWNEGPKTRAYYSYGLGLVDGNVGKIINSTLIYKGQLF